MTVKRYQTRFFNDRGQHNLPTHAERQAAKVTGDYDFARGDVRKLDRNKAQDAAMERAALSGYVQQVSQVDGPLLGQRIWLIQETAIKIEPEIPGGFKIGDRVVTQLSKTIGVVVGSGGSGDLVMIEVEKTGELTNYFASVLKRLPAKPEPLEIPVEYQGNWNSIGHMREVVKAAGSFSDDAMVSVEKRAMLGEYGPLQTFLVVTEP